MTDKLKTYAVSLANFAVVQKYATGDVDVPSAEAIAGEMTILSDAIMEFVEARGRSGWEQKPLGDGDAILQTVRSKPRNAPAKVPGAAPGRASVIPQDELATYIGAAKRSLKDVAEHFSASPGQAQRALEKVNNLASEPGAQVPGKRGKAPTVYFLKP
jgi:hypothetical protein